MWLTVITTLYAGNSLITLLAYLPQIKKLLWSKSKPVNFSFLSWTMWTYSGLIATMYAIFIVSDMLLMLVSGINFIGCFAVWLLVIYKNAKYAAA